MNKKEMYRVVFRILFIEVFTGIIQLEKAIWLVELMDEIYLDGIKEFMIESSTSQDGGNLFKDLFEEERNSLERIGGLEETEKFRIELKELLNELSNSLTKGGN